MADPDPLTGDKPDEFDISIIEKMSQLTGHTRTLVMGKFFTLMVKSYCITESAKLIDPQPKDAEDLASLGNIIESTMIKILRHATKELKKIKIEKEKVTE